MATQGCILYAKEEHAIPKVTLQRLADKFKSCTCSARVEDGDFKIFKKAAEVDIDNLFTMMNQDRFLQHNVLMYMGSSDSSVYRAEDLPPYPCLTMASESKDDPPTIIAVCFCEGDMPPGVKPDNHIAEWHIAQIFSKIAQEVFDDPKRGDGDIDDTIEYLDGPSLRSQIMERCFGKGRGQITLFTVTDKIISFSNNKDLKEYEFGWLSNPMEPAPKPSASVPATGSKLSPAEELARRKAAKAAAQEDDIDITKKPATGPVEGPTPPPAGDPNELVEIGPPPADLTNKGKKQWWNRLIGEVPGNFKFAKVKVPRSKIRTKDTPVPVPGKQEQAAALSEAVVHNNGSLIAPQVIEGIKADFAKGKVKLMNGQQREEWESSNPLFCEQTTIPLEEIMGWHPDEVEKFVTKYPTAAWTLLFETVSNYMEALSDLDKATSSPAPATVNKPDEKKWSDMTPEEKIAYKKAQKASKAA